MCNEVTVWFRGFCIKISEIENQHRGRDRLRCRDTHLLITAELSKPHKPPMSKRPHSLLLSAPKAPRAHHIQSRPIRTPARKRHILQHKNQILNLIPKHNDLRNRLQSQPALMLHQQMRRVAPERRAQQRQERLGAGPEALEGDMLPRSAVHCALDDEVREEVVDVLLGDVAQVFDVAFGVGGHGFPQGERDVGPGNGFAGCGSDV